MEPGQWGAGILVLVPGTQSLGQCWTLGADYSKWAGRPSLGALRGRCFSGSPTGDGSARCGVGSRGEAGDVLSEFPT